MSLHVLADHMASKGRGPDSMLVHMSPREVAGLHALALKHGGELTINPDTGLPEAGFLDKLLPTIIGAGLTIFGGVPPHIAAAMVGGIQTVRTGSLERGLMAGFGAYGGAGLAQGFMGAGATTLAGNATALAAEQAGNLAGEEALRYGAEQGLSIEAAEAAKAMAIENASNATARVATDASPFAKLSAGASSVTASPEAMGSFAKDNFKYLAATTAPVLAGAMVPTTTKAPPVSPSFIRQKRVNPDGTVTDLTPVNAADFGSRNFSDIYRGYNGGGIVALAGGGMQHFEDGGGVTAAPPPAINSVADLYQSVLGRGVESEGAAGYWANQFGPTIDANEIAAFKAAAAPEIAARPTQTADTSNTGLAALNTNTAGGMPLAAAQADVGDIYRSVLGRDADPTGLAYWSQQFATNKDSNAVYNALLASARQNNELIRPNAPTTFADASKDYTGFMSTDTGNIVDEWVRTTLGREPTAADRQQSWYKDAANKMTTQGEAQGLYGQFQGYATKEATTETANRIKAIDAELRAKNLTEADLLAQTGKTKQQLATEGLNTNLNLMSASQLTPAGSRTAYDLKAKLAALKPVATTQTVLGTNSQTNAPAGTTNPYGNINNPGDITFNPDGSRTVTPNIPGRPYGGFSGMNEVKNAYTQGGGSLGYTSPVVKTAEELDATYNKQTGDSLAAYNYLMGKGANPVKSGVGQISKPYAEEVLGYPASTNKMYNYDAATGKMVRNLDYVAPGRDSKGNVTYGMSLNEIKKYLTTNPLSGQALYDWAKSNDASAQDIADATGRKLSDVYAEFRASAKKATTATDAVDSGTSTGGFAMGGMTGYAVGGGLGSLGSYSDGGRLLKGPGDGVSDSIPATIGAKQQPARLADGEFVVPARIVSELGNGSTDAGAKKLYAMMDRVQRARGKTTGKNKVAANSRADKYLPA